MKKTLTMSLALVGIAGLALAEIATPEAGYIEKTGSATALLVSNPFGSFSGNAPTLGDLDGSGLGSADFVKIISEKGKTLFTAYYRPDATPPGWYDTNDGCSNAFPLARGKSIQFYSPHGTGTLVMAGTFDQNGAEFGLLAGHNFIGNARPTKIYLRDVRVSSFAPLGGDYAMVNNTKVVYLNASLASKINKSAGWYLYSDINGSDPANATDIDYFIPAGEGFRVYVKKTPLPTISLPGLNN